MLQQRYETLRNKVALSEMKRATLLEHLHSIETELKQNEEEIGVLSKAGEVLKSLLEDMAKENLNSIDKVVTEGLRQVFHDQTDITFKSELVDKSNQLQISFKTEQGQSEGKSLDSFGASVTVVQSLLLRILVILKMGLAPVLLLDESLAQVSDEYVEPLGKLIRKLCRDLGLTILFVTHQRSFTETADVVYVADAKEDTIRTLVLKKVKDSHGDISSY